LAYLAVGSNDLIERLEKDALFMENERAAAGLHEMKLLLKYLGIFNTLDNVSFDLSLARGLDYYTGVIYEAVVMDEAGVGSIAGGGRYDELVGMFAQSKNVKIPCVGFSIGVERIYSILKSKAALSGKAPRQIATDVYVASVDGLLEERMKICAELWDAGIKADFMYKNRPKLLKQFEYCDKPEHAIPLIVIVGADEVSDGKVRIKDQAHPVESQKNGVLVDRKDMVAELRKRLQ
jgi:histidyl-tRNA synthetase